MALRNMRKANEKKTCTLERRLLNFEVNESSQNFPWKLCVGEYATSVSNSSWFDNTN